jgi:CRP/FNR family transcriptional regulator
MDEVFQSGVSDAADRFTGLGEQAAAPSSDHDESGPAAPVRTLSSGEILFREGDPKVHLHQISAGVVCVYQPRTGRSEEVIEFVFPGDVLGLGYLEHQIYWARALVKSRITCLPLSSLNNIVKCDQRAKQRHAQALHREFAYRRHLFSASNRQKPIGRLAAFLLAVSEFNKDEGRDPTIVTDSLNCGVVGEWLALDFDNLRRALVELQKRRLIEPCDPLGLRLIDRVGLEALADGGVIALQ